MPARQAQTEPTGLSKRPELRFYIPGSLSLRQLFRLSKIKRGRAKQLLNVNPMSVLHSDGRKENVKTECRKQRGGRHGKLHCIHIVPFCGLHVPSRPILHTLMLGTGVVNQIELLSA